MKRWSVIAILGGFSFFTQSCKNFEGFVNDPREGYTSEYNLPGTRTVPYNDPLFTAKPDQRGINLCENLSTENGLQCKP